MHKLFMRTEKSPTPAFRYNHLVIPILVGDDVIFIQIENGNGIQFSRHAASSSGFAYFRGVHQCLYDGVFSWSQVVVHRDVAPTHTLERLKVKIALFTQ